MRKKKNTPRIPGKMTPCVLFCNQTEFSGRIKDVSETGAGIIITTCDKGNAGYDFLKESYQIYLQFVDENTFDPKPYILSVPGTIIHKEEENGELYIGIKIINELYKKYVENKRAYVYLQKYVPLNHHVSHA